MTPIDALFLAGRVILGGYFLQAGVAHFTKHGMLTQYAATQGVPAPGLAVAASGALLVAGGTSLVLGLFPAVGLALLALFLIGVTPQMHAWWKVEDPMTRMAEQVNFAKNAALLGAVVALYAVPTPWAASVAAML